MRYLSITLLVGLSVATAARCQVDPVAVESRVVAVDSGYLDHVGDQPKVVFSREVQVPGACWMRLFFASTHLPAGCELRLTARRDQAIQRHDAGSLRDYAQSSAYFNGDTVLVELIAAVGSRRQRVRVVRVEYLRGPSQGPESICGSIDDRRLSSDPRIGRAVSGAGACTWWLIDEFTILTAGHCATGASSPLIIGFNIPLSTANGTYVQPPPADQYPVDLTTLHYGTGVGSDWAVVAANRNSNHGLYPGQRQGSWFKLGAVPAGPAGVDIRITGNGRVSAPVSPTWNAVQKTHVGPCVRTAGYLQYRTDTTGGNSGSPIIHEQTGAAIGIHTHGGCSASSGQNSGTRIDLAALSSAIAAVRSSKVAGSLGVFGSACGTAPQRPALSLSGIPDLGGQVEVRVDHLPAARPGLLLVGASDTAWRGATLPLDLGPLGFATCSLYVSIDVEVGLGTGAGTMLQRLTIPQLPSLIGNPAFLQFAVATGGAAGAVFSNAGVVRIGG